MLSWLAKRMIARNMEPWLRYEDTQKSKALDEYLASTGNPLSRLAIGGSS